MTVTKLAQSQAKLPLQALPSSGGNLLYTIQALFMRVTSQLSVQNQESQKRLVQTKKDYRLATAKTAGFIKDQGDSSLYYAGLGIAPALVAGAIGMGKGPISNFLTENKIESITYDNLFNGVQALGNIGEKLVSGRGSQVSYDQRQKETSANGEAQIHNTTLSDSQPKGDESTLKNVIDQLLESIRRTYQSASR